MTVNEKDRAQIRAEFSQVFETQIEPLFFDERLHKPNQGLILQTMVFGMEVFGDIAPESSKRTRDFIGFVYKTKDYYQNRESVDLTMQKAGEIFGLFLNPDYSRNQREAILLTLVQHSRDKKIINGSQYLGLSGFIRDITRR